MAVERALRLMVKGGCAVDPARCQVFRYLNVQYMPLVPGNGQIEACPFNPLVVDEFKQDSIVFQRVDPENEVVADVAQPEDQSAGLVDAARHRLDLEGEGRVAHRAAFLSMARGKE